jgi:hypothetical protein
LFGNQDTSDVQFKIILPGVIVVEEVDGCSVGDVENGGEHNFSIGIEVNPVHGRVGLFADALVEIYVILFVDIVLISQPQGFVLVDSFPFIDCPLYLFSFLFFGLFFDFEIIL